MSESLSQQLADASFRIITRQEKHAYGVLSLVAVPSSKVEAIFDEPIFASSVYMVPDYANPRLHKANMALGDITDEVADEHIQPNLDYLSLNQNPYNPDGYRELSWKIRAACEELEDTEADRQKPFRILGMSAIYMMGGASYMYQFYSREFLDALAEQIDPIPSPGHVSESAYRQMYAVEAEHKLDLPPFEKWIQQKYGAVNRRLDSGADMETQAAVSYAQPLLLPLEDMAPTLRVQLFEPIYD